MAIKKGKLQELDAAVGSALTPDPSPINGRGGIDPVFGGLERVRRARNMTPGQRRKAEKDARRNRVMIDLPKELEAVLDRIAAELSVPRSQVASYLMLLGLWAAEIDELREAREPSRSMRYEYILAVYPKIPDKWR